MHNEHDDDLVLKRQRELDESGSFGWMFLPALCGIFAAILFAVVIPSVARSMMMDASMGRIGEQLLMDMEQQFAPLLTLQWGGTLLWAYIIGGALGGIILYNFFHDDRA